VKSRFLSIQIRTFLVFGAFISLTLAVTGWGVARYFESVAQRRIAQQQFDLVSLLATAMDDRITLYLGSLKAGAQEAPGGLPESSPAAARWLKDRPAIRDLFENGIFLFDPEGRILASNTKTPLSPALQEGLRPFFQALAVSGKDGVSEAYRSESSGIPAVMMAAPLIGRHGKVRLFLAGGIDLSHDDFLGAIGNQRMPDTSYLTLIDGQDRILIHPNPARILTQIGRFGRLEPRAGKEGNGERVNAGGTPTLTSVKHLKVVPWTLAASIPVTQAHAPIDRFRRYLKAAIAAAVALTLVLTWFLSHQLTENLESFTAQIESAAYRPAGERRIQIKAHDETAILVDAFNGLMARLDDKTVRLMQAKAEQDDELTLAKHVLKRLVEPGLQAMPSHLHMETLQTQRINGDVCAYREGMPGIHFGLVCDATGHGLTAGISTLPAIQAFLGMANRDIPLETIYAEINRKVHRMMPVERFVCLALLRMDTQNGTLSMLNAGLPDAILCSPGGGRRSFASRNLPAGIQAEPENPIVETVAVAPGDRLLAFTDGVLDLLRAEEADRFLLRGLEQCPLEIHLRAVQEALALSLGNQEPHDDVSWALWEMPTPSCARLQSAGTFSTPSDAPLEEGMALELTFSPRLHGVRDVVPEVIRLLSSRGLGARDEQTLTLALTEALANAVDHGVLGLDSQVKEQGFEAYEALRRLRLAATREGFVKLTLHLRVMPLGPLREVGVEVEDSGPGFDWRAWEEGGYGNGPIPSGRGLLLLRALARGLAFNEAGNRIRFTLPCG